MMYVKGDLPICLKRNFLVFAFCLFLHMELRLGHKLKIKTSNHRASPVDSVSNAPKILQEKY